MITTRKVMRANDGFDLFGDVSQIATEHIAGDINASRSVFPFYLVWRGGDRDVSHFMQRNLHPLAVSMRMFRSADTSLRTRGSPHTTTGICCCLSYTSPTLFPATSVLAARRICAAVSP